MSNVYKGRILGGVLMEIKDVSNLSPNEFEVFISNLVEAQGYKVKLFAAGEDIGIDIIAENEKESIAIQVKKYNNRKINLAMIYHTYAAAAYYDCTKSRIVTLSELTPKAVEVAKKLNVEIWDKDVLFPMIQSLDSVEIPIKVNESSITEDWFFEIWNNHIKDLERQKVKHLSRDTYITVVEVNDDGLSIVNSNGRKRDFSIDIFRYILTKLRNSGCITREEINFEYQRRGSSAISAIIVTIPGIYKDVNIKKTTIVWDR